MTAVQNKGPLAGIRVMDISIMAAGPWAGALLGMLGAEVIKVEPPAGDGTRFVTPMQRGMGTNFIAMNINKTGIKLDLKSEAGRAQALELAAGCDVFLQNLRVGVMPRLGLDYDALKKINPRLVYCSVSGYGEVGPLAKAGCADPIMQAYSGFARGNGAPGEDLEAFRFTGFLDLATAGLAAEAIMAALLARESTGLGQHVGVSMLEAALEVQATRVAEWLGGGVPAQPRGSESCMLAPDRAFATLDREVFVTACSDAEWRGFCTAIERVELADDPRFANNRARVAARDALYAEVAPLFLKRPALWWLRALEKNGVPCAIAHDFATFRHHQQIVANKMLAKVVTREWGELTLGGTPWHFSQTPCAVEPPAFIESNDDTAMRRVVSAKPQAPRAQSASLLQGLRVIEFAEGVAGPLASVRLGDLGAEVIKIETGEGDWMRSASPAFAAGDTSAAFFELNRGKQALHIAADAAGGVMLRRLLDGADVFITDRSDLELKAMGIDLFDGNCDARNPDLIAVRITPFGAKGPLIARRGSDLTAQAMAGYTRYLGKFGQPARRLGADVAGTGAAMFARQAVLAALWHRLAGGGGQNIEVSLLNSLLTLKSVHLGAQSDPDAYIGPRAGAANYPQDLGWRCADGRIYFIFGGSVGVDGKAGWVSFVEEVGLAHLLEDKRFDKSGRNSTGHGVRAHDLVPEYERAFEHYPAEQLAEIVRKHGGSASVYQRLDEALEHAQTQALAIVRDVPGADGARAKVRAYPARFSAMTPRLEGRAPRLDEHGEALRAQNQPRRGD